MKYNNMKKQLYELI